MKINDAGLAIIKHFESCELESYPDPKTKGPPWTIGWGHTSGVVSGDKCTPQQADEWLLEDVATFERMISENILVNLDENQFSALVSLIYNVGPGRITTPARAGKDGVLVLKHGPPSTLLRMLRDGKYEEASNQFLRWVSPGSEVERGLRRRRVAERALFLGHDWEQALEHHILVGG